jgi:hypothetical protein
MHFMALNGLLPVVSNVRYCFVGSPSGDPKPSDAVPMDPAPAVPGLAPGLLAPINVPSSIVGQNVRVYVYYTSSLDSFKLESATCQQLLAASILTSGDAGLPAGDGGAQLVQGLDFDVSDEIPSSTWSATAPYLIYSTGCPLSSQPAQIGDVGYCGFPADAGGVGVFNGDFHVYALQLDNSAPAAGKVNMQGVNGTTLNNYWQTQVPWAYDLGFQYGDAGVPEGGVGQLGDAATPGVTLINGPDDGGPGDYGYSSLLSTGPVYPPTGVASIGTASYVLAVTSAWAPQGNPPFPQPGVELYFPIDQILQLSNLTQADLSSGTSFTMVLLGDALLSNVTPDGGANPLAWNFCLIRNDKL